MNQNCLKDAGDNISRLETQVSELTSQLSAANKYKGMYEEALRANQSKLVSRDQQKKSELTASKAENERSQIQETLHKLKASAL